MSHLSMEALARLVDEPADALEAHHLDACTECRSELDALRVQTAALAGLPPLEPSAGAWDRLLGRLRAEGLVRSPTPRVAFAGGAAGLRMAASIALLLVGGVAGAALQSRLGDAAADAAPAGAQAGPASAGGDLELAAARLQQAESDYMAALASYEDLTRAEDTDDAPLARLAALEGIVVTTRAALDEAPTDPVINGYHLTALAQRDATLRRIASTGGDPWF